MISCACHVSVNDRGPLIAGPLSVDSSLSSLSIAWLQSKPGFQGALTLLTSSSLLHSLAPERHLGLGHRPLWTHAPSLRDHPGQQRGVVARSLGGDSFGRQASTPHISPHHTTTPHTPRSPRLFSDAEPLGKRPRTGLDPPPLTSRWPREESRTRSSSCCWHEPGGG